MYTIKQNQNTQHTVTLSSKDKNWQNEQTIYWFNVGDEKYGVSDINGNLSVLFDNGENVETNDKEYMWLDGLKDLIKNHWDD